MRGEKNLFHFTRVDTCCASEDNGETGVTHNALRTYVTGVPAQKGVRGKMGGFARNMNCPDLPMNQPRIRVSRVHHAF